MKICERRNDTEHGMSEETSQPQIQQSYCFKWSDYHNHLSTVVKQLLDEDCMVDVTLSVGGERIRAHRMVLCACSTLFQEILSETKEDHPTIIISDISPQDVRSIVQFSYQGEVRIPVENISNLLDAAQLLRISGLMEIEGLDENDTIISKELTEEIDEELDESGDKDVIEAIEGDEICISEVNDDNSNEVKKKKKKRDHVKRDYNDDMLEKAINDLKNGKTLVEASTKNHIPRSTLYMRAKTLGIQLNASRSEYPPECMKAAINTVLNGSSLQHASEMYGIPKTVLWRRMQKEGYQIIRSEAKRSYGSERREAAIKALARGENLTTVAHEYNIPKTTLFRDKTKLVGEGKLPESFWKKRKGDDEELKKSRLEEAVAACKDGKMSQAAAAIAYRIPKTTIWRKLHQENGKIDNSGHSNKKQKVDNEKNRDKSESGDAFTLCEVSSEIPITYIDENSIPQDSVIILTTEDVDDLNLEDERQIIVTTDSTQEYVPCTMSIDEDSNYTSAET